MLEWVGLSPERKIDPGGSTYYSARLRSGDLAYYFKRECDGKGLTDCKGLEIIMRFDPPPGKMRADLLERANIFNEIEKFAKATIEKNNAISLRVNVFADGGITESNLFRRLQLVEEARSNLIREVTR